MKGNEEGFNNNSSMKEMYESLYKQELHFSTTIYRNSLEVSCFLRKQHCNHFSLLIKGKKLYSAVFR